MLLQGYYGPIFRLKCCQRRGAVRVYPKAKEFLPPRTLGLADAGDRRPQHFLPLRLSISHSSLSLRTRKGLSKKNGLHAFSQPVYLSANSISECLRLTAALLKLLRVGGVSPNTCPGIGASCSSKQALPSPPVPLLPQAVHEQ